MKELIRYYLTDSLIKALYKLYKVKLGAGGVTWKELLREGDIENAIKNRQTD